MNTVKTVYTVKTFEPRSKNSPYAPTPPDIIEVNATGQEAANAVDKQYREKGFPFLKIIKGFIINDVFVKVDFSSHWDRTAMTRSIPIHI